jgi:hypothetical protein
VWNKKLKIKLLNYVEHQGYKKYNNMQNEKLKTCSFTLTGKGLLLK